MSIKNNKSPLIIIDGILSTLRQLRRLECKGNFLHEVDTLELVGLVDLICSDGDLVELDLSNSSKLIGLSCCNNKIQELDLKGSPKLKVLACTDNDLRSLDVSGLTYLATLDCDDNPSLASGIKGISSLTDHPRSKNVSIQRTGHTANQLNDLFHQLPTDICRSGFVGRCGWYINISENPSASDTSGTDGCDVSIAKDKGWRVINSRNLSYESYVKY